MAFIIEANLTIFIKKSKSNQNKTNKFTIKEMQDRLDQRAIETGLCTNTNTVHFNSLTSMSRIISVVVGFSTKKGTTVNVNKRLGLMTIVCVTSPVKTSTSPTPLNLSLHIVTGQVGMTVTEATTAVLITNKSLRTTFLKNKANGDISKSVSNNKSW